MNYLRNDMTNSLPINSLKDKFKIMSLTPCHSMPHVSYLHQNVTIKFLTCEPNLDGSIDNYIDEADVFYNDPYQWIHSHPHILRQFTHLIMYEKLFNEIDQKTTEEHLKHNLKDDEGDCFKNDWKQFSICGRFFHKFVSDPSDRTDKYILLLCKTKKVTSNVVDNRIFKEDL
jgi:hypothetical protein